MNISQHLNVVLLTKRFCDSKSSAPHVIKKKRKGGEGEKGGREEGEEEESANLMTKMYFVINLIEIHKVNRLRKYN